MAKSKAVKPKKRGRRPATGRDPFVGIRLPAELIQAVEIWAGRNDTSSRSEAFRWLVELGLAASVSSQPHSAKTRAKAAGMAHEVLDRHADQTATPEEQASRKRKLLKGPEEFRQMRKDLRAKP
jgi:hypothetical protein